MAVVADCRESSDELVTRYAQIILQLAIGKVPHEQWKRLLRLVAAHAHLAIGRGEQTVEEAILARLEGGLQVLDNRGQMRLMVTKGQQQQQQHSPLSAS